MINYRPFRNTDPYHLAEVWRTSLSGHGVMQPMSPMLLEYFAFSKPYFVYDGLTVALDDKTPIGFIHGGFGPTADRSSLDLSTGIVCFMAVRPEYRRQGIAKELLAHCENYLEGRGAQTIYAGGARPLDPFYLGIYGGSEMPGVLASLPEMEAFLSSQGYQQASTNLILECELTKFRPPVNRNLVQIGRNTTIDLVYDPPPRDWWDACTFGNFERVRFELYMHPSRELIGEVTLWMLDPLAHSWGVRAVGLTDFEIKEEYRRQGYGTYLISEALRRLYEQGIWLVQVQSNSNETGVLELFSKLGFSEIDRGNVYVKY